jgi:hypothetical protein
MRERILTDLFKSQDLKDLINKMEPVELRDDLTQELAIILCELNEEKLAGLAASGQLRYFVVGLVVRMIQSKNSRFYYKFRKYKEFERSNTDLGINVGEEDDKEPIAFKYIIVDTTEDMTPEQKEAAFTLLVDRTRQAIEDLPEYHKELLTWYLRLGSAPAVVEDMKSILKGRFIPKRSILRAVKEAKEIILKKVPVC